VLRRATITVVLLAALAWSSLLFGIGLDDLTDGRTRPGVIASIVLLCLVIAGLLFAVWRLARPHLARRLARH
jgi:hypothetical protein